MKQYIHFAQILLLPIFVLSADLNSASFPNGFLFGVSTAAYQIEGGWNEDGKSASVWDTFTHDHPEKISDRTNGDVACDSYHKVDEDVALLAELGVNYYRFSISWSRLLPLGDSSVVNGAGLDYYNHLIDKLLANNIMPMVTLYHWDLPQRLQDQGGWETEQMINYFVDYATVAFESFGDRVPYWITFNEPAGVCTAGYGDGSKAPGVTKTGTADYICAHNILKAHATVWHLYDDVYRGLFNGKISITLDSTYYEPQYEDNQDDWDAQDRILQWSLGWFAHPIFIGDYPEIMKTRIYERSLREGFEESRLPWFSDDEVAYIKGTYDFFALNNYATKLVNTYEWPIGEVKWWNDIGVSTWADASWETAASDWLTVVPWGLRKLLNWVRDQYGDVEIYITENGYSDFGEIDDTKRIEYLQQYMSAVLDAIYEDKIHVKSYTVWSLMDNFEWAEGYTHRFGLYGVDFDSPDRTRYKKASADVFKQIIQAKKLV